MSETVQTKVDESPARVANADGAEVFAVPVYRSERREHEYLVEVEMPGVAKPDVQIGLEDDVVTVTGVRRANVPSAWRPIHEEVAKRSYRLRLKLNRDVDSDRIEAHVENGVLRLTFPLRDEVKPRVIEVQ